MKWDELPWLFLVTLCSWTTKQCYLGLLREWLAGFSQGQTGQAASPLAARCPFSLDQEVPDPSPLDESPAQAAGQRSLVHNHGGSGHRTGPDTWSGPGPLATEFPDRNTLLVLAHLISAACSCQVLPKKLRVDLCSPARPSCLPPREPSLTSCSSPFSPEDPPPSRPRTPHTPIRLPFPSLHQKDS